MSNNTTADVTGIFSLDTNRLVGLAAKGSPDVTYLAGQDTPTSGIPLTATLSDGGIGISDVAGIRSPSLTLGLLSCGMPFIIPAGDGGTNGLSFNGGGGGAFTLSSAILSGLIVPAAYFYLPANAGGSGCTAGWYYGVMLSATTGVIYGNTYDPASELTPSIPANIIAFSGSPAGRITQVTTEQTAVQKTIPGGIVGRNGYLEAGCKLIGTATAGAKTYRFRAGAVVLHSFPLVATNCDIDMLAWSRMAHGSLQSQVNTRTAQPVGGATNTLNGDYTTADFSTSQSLIFSMQIAANTESMVLYPSFIRATCVN